jgi:uncharacterized repeat protein (TIGR01451 family)
VDISSGGPLTHVWIGNDLSCQVQHIADAPDYEFYGPDIFPGDAGTFIAMGGVLYAPDFANHDYSSAEFFLGAYAPFTPVSQTGVTGSGTAADPFKVITVVGVAATGLVIQQTDTYVTGREYYTTEIKISNNGADTASGVLYRAADAFLGGSDTGYGFTQVFSGNRKAVGCSNNADNMPPGKIEEFIALTGGNNYFQNRFDMVWSAIGSQAPFPDTSASTTLLDNGAGINWNFSIPAGDSATYSHVTTFSPLGFEGLVTSKTADSPTSPAGTQNGYTITIQNPNVNDVTVSSITDTLPAGFAYVSGSTTSATTNEPAIAAQMLTWSGSFTVPASGSISLHFAVTVATTPGDYFNEAGGSAEENYNVIDTGPTAKITVTAASPTPTATATATANATATPTATATVAATATPTPTPTVAGANLNVSAASGTYGGSTTFTATLTSDGNPVANKTINFTLNGHSAGSGITDASGLATSNAVLLYGSSYNAGFYPTGAAASFDADASFSASSGTNSLTVNKAKLILSADNKTRLYGSPNPTLTAHYTGFVQSDTLATSGVMGQPTLTTGATQFSPPAKYPITFVQGTLPSATNYEIIPVDGTLTVYLSGIIGLQKITIGASSAVVDSYDSSMGPYSQSNQSNDTTLLSNGTITLQGAKIHGDMISTQGNVILQANSLVTGDVTYATTLSNQGIIQGTIYHQTNQPIVAPIPVACGTYTSAPVLTGAYTYDAAKGNLTVSGGGTATLASGTYCFNNVTVSGGSTLRINGTVIINVTGKFTDSGGSLQNTSLIPFNLQVSSSYTGNNGVNITGTSATYVTIYAPGTDLTVSGGGPLYGALVCKTLTVSGNSFVHQDLALPDVWSVFGP